MKKMFRDATKDGGILLIMDQEFHEKTQREDLGVRDPPRGWTEISGDGRKGDEG